MFKRKDTDFLAVSARIHAMETRMLSRERMERMIDAKDAGDALKILEECGYADAGRGGLDGLEKMLAAERCSVFQDVHDAVPDPSLVEVFQLKYDYHNAKVLVKADAVGADPVPLLLPGGRYDCGELLEGWRREELTMCSDSYAKAMQEAAEVLSETGDPQQADLILDAACYGEMAQLARRSGSRFLQGYVELSVDTANLRTLVRCARLEKDAEFVARVLLPGGSVDGQTLALARPEQWKELFSFPALCQAAQEGEPVAQPGGGPLTAFERMCDDALTDYLAQSRQIPFGEEVVIGYLYSKEAEITAVRIILSGRMAGLDAETIRSRLRAVLV